MIPVVVIVKMNIGMLKQFVPQISELYNNSRTELTLNIKANSSLLTTIKENKIHIQFRTILTFYSIEEDGLKEVVSLESSLDIHAAAAVSNWTIKPTISGTSFSPFKVIGTQAETSDTIILQNRLNLIISFALPAVSLIKPLIPLLDVPIVNLSSLTFAVHDGYLRIEAYPQYKIAQKASQEKEKAEVEKF